MRPEVILSPRAAGVASRPPETRGDWDMLQWLRRLDELFPLRYSTWLLCAVLFLISAPARVAR